MRTTVTICYRAESNRQCYHPHYNVLLPCTGDSEVGKNQQFLSFFRDVLSLAFGYQVSVLQSECRQIYLQETHTLEAFSFRKVFQLHIYIYIYIYNTNQHDSLQEGCFQDSEPSVRRSETQHFSLLSRYGLKSSECTYMKFSLLFDSRDAQCGTS
jgi:hypothetical protein